MAFPTTPIPLPTTSAPGSDGYSGGLRLINMYATKRIVRGKPAVQISAIDGLTRYKLLSGGAIRGMIDVAGRLYVVAGINLYHRDPTTEVWTVLGSISGNRPVRMAANRRSPRADLGIVANAQYYCVRDGVLTTPPVDSDLPPPVDITVFNGRFVFPISDGRVFVSEVDDGLTVDALAFGTGETYSDVNIGIGVRGSDVCLFGSASIEFLRDAGTTPWPFDLAHAIPVGCLSATSIAEVNESIVWVADDNTVRRLDGYTPTPISTVDVQEAIDRASDKHEIEATVYERAGVRYVKFSCSSFTWVWNGTSGDWHEEKSNGLSRWRGRSSIIFADKHLVGDYDNGIIYEVSPTAYDEDGTRIICELHTAIDGYPTGMIINRLFVDGQTGVGLNTTIPEDQDPELMIDVSRDGGRTWTIQRRAKLGAIGEFGKRPVAHRLGRFDGRGARLRVSCSASVLRVISGLSADIEALEP